MAIKEKREADLLLLIKKKTSLTIFQELKIDERDSRNSTAATSSSALKCLSDDPRSLTAITIKCNQPQPPNWTSNQEAPRPLQQGVFDRLGPTLHGFNRSTYWIVSAHLKGGSSRADPVTSND